MKLRKRPPTQNPPARIGPYVTHIEHWTGRPRPSTTDFVYAAPRMSRSRPSVTRYCLALLFGLAASLPTAAYAQAEADKPEKNKPDTDEPDTDKPDAQIRLRLELGGVGYQGNWTRQSFAEPSGASLRVQRHGGELSGGYFNAVSYTHLTLPTIYSV